MRRRSKTNPWHWSGVDVSKDVFDASIVYAGQKVSNTPICSVPVETFERSSKGVTAYLKWLDEHCDEPTEVIRIVMEATGGYSEELAIWILEARPVSAPAIVNAHYTAKFIASCGARNKTDRYEARLLGFYGMEREPIAYEPPTEEQRQLRELSRYRDALIKQQTTEKNRLRQHIATDRVRQMQERRLRALGKDIKKIEHEIKQLIQDTPCFKKDYQRLNTIYGVSFVTASVIMAELGDLRRFSKARQLTAFAGLSPRIKQSGTSVRGKTKLCKQGNPRIRQALYMAAMSSVTGRNDMGYLHQRLKKKGKSGKESLGVVMRKLLCVMRSMLIHEKDYDALWKTKRTAQKL